MKKIAIVTGSSKGLGLALVRELKHHGYFVVGMSRSKGGDESDHFIQGDITDAETQDTLLLETLKYYQRIDLLVNNAGSGMYESWEEGSTADLRGMFELNFFAAVSLTQKALAELKKSGGLIVNVSSVAGKIALPFMGGYCATKYALNAFSDSLRAELHGSGAGVLNLVVGRVETGFSMNSSGDKKPPHTPGKADAADYAKKVMAAISKRKKEVVFPGWYRGVILFYTFFKGFFEKLAKWKFDATLKE